MSSEDIYQYDIDTELLKELKNIPNLPSSTRTVEYKKHREDISNLTKHFPEDVKIDERLYCIINNLKEPLKCPVCRGKMKFRRLSSGYQGKTCSAKCGQKIQTIELSDNGVTVKQSAARKRLETINERYGEDAFSTMAKKREENMKSIVMDDGRTAAEHRTQKRLKTASIVGDDGLTSYQRVAYNNHKRGGYTKQNSIKRHNTLMNDIIDGKNGYQRIGEKSKETLDTIVDGGKTLRQLASVKMSESILGEKVLELLNDADYLKSKTTFEISSELGVAESTIVKRRNKLGIPHPATPQSSLERIVLDIIKKYYSGEIICNTRRIITPKEIDIYIPDLNLAFEVNGIYRHGERQGKYRGYHLNKTRMCKEVGVRLIHIFENEILEKRHIVESRIKNILGKSKRIYARKCSVVECTSKQATEFMERNHIQGPCGSRFRYGLMYNNEIVAMMTFGLPRNKNTSEQYELIRYCSEAGTTIVGGASKLLKHFIKTNKPKSIISYCDRRWGTGNLYTSIGFEFVVETRPNYFYFKQGSIELHSRNKFQKHKLSKVLESFDESLSEWENMKANGYDRIWDCGNLVYKWCK